jgi:hypothetical protein
MQVLRQEIAHAVFLHWDTRQRLQQLEINILILHALQQLVGLLHLVVFLILGLLLAIARVVFLH